MDEISATTIRFPSATRARLLLASSSPRRSQLLKQAGVRFDTIDSGVDDAALRFSGAVTPRAWAMALANLKAAAAHDRLRRGAQTRDATILGADTIVVKDGRVIGQPRDRDDARAIICSLRAGAHTVVSGVALIDADTGERVLFVDEAHVRLGDIDDDRVEAYLDTDAWRGKAGAYNLSERIADGWPIQHEGDPATVMGLPMVRLAPLLRTWLDENPPS
jgi:septum formation protein